MRVKFTPGYVAGIKATGKAFWLTDAGFPNLRLYVGVSGSKTWYASFRGDDNKKKSYKLGSADVITVAEARDMARDFLARLSRGEQPYKKPDRKLQLGELIEEYYCPWVESNRKTGTATMAILRSSFRFLFCQPIEELKKIELERWQMQRQKDGSKAATINRLTTALKAALNWGVDRELIPVNPIARLKPLQERDSDKKTRYLSDDEKVRLMVALDEREASLRAGRESHNRWLTERGKEPLPLFDSFFVDYLKPLILLAMNTGIRKSDLLGLKWGDVNFEKKTISFIPGKTDSSSGDMLHLSMNKKVIEVLSFWRKQSIDTSPEAFIFPSSRKKGAVMVGTRRSWMTVLKAAKIEDFRWHDLRHDFASQLVMRGTDLNVVRELLGHADMKMTLRYAHLAPENKLRAVELLDD